MGKFSTSLRRSMDEVINKNDKYPVWKEKLIDIKDWIQDKTYYAPRAKYKAVKRVLGWIPILWSNYDWDYNYLFEVMRYKLDCMEKHIRAEGHAVSSSRTADEIKTAKLLLDRICEGEYLENATKTVEQQWGTWTFDWSSSRLNKIWTKDLSEAEKGFAERDTMRAYKHSDYMEKQDVEYLFKFMQKHHKKWWD